MGVAAWRGVALTTWRCAAVAAAADSWAEYKSSSLIHPGGVSLPLPLTKHGTGRPLLTEMPFYSERKEEKEETLRRKRERRERKAISCLFFYQK